MDEKPTLSSVARAIFGLNTPEVDAPAGAQFTASLIGGLVVGAIFWFVIHPVIGLVVVAFSILQGIAREVVRARSQR